MLGNLAAYLRLRPVWKQARRSSPARGEGDAKGAGGNAAGGEPTVARSAGGKAARASRTRPADAAPPDGSATGTRAGGTRAGGGREGPVPSRTRVLVNIAVGLLVTVASLAALIARG